MCILFLGLTFWGVMTLNGQGLRPPRPVGLGRDLTKLLSPKYFQEIPKSSRKV
jgi:hypothetical protein